MSEIGATSTSISSWALTHGSGREDQCWPSTVASRTSGVVSVGTARYATTPCTASTAVFVTSPAGSVSDTCVHDPPPAVVRHRVAGLHWEGGALSRHGLTSA